MKRKLFTARFWVGGLIGFCLVGVVSILVMVMSANSHSVVGKSSTEKGPFGQEGSSETNNDSSLANLLNSTAALEEKLLSYSPLEKTLAINTLLDDLDERDLLGFLPQIDEFNTSALSNELQDATVRRLALFDSRKTLRQIASLAPERQVPLVSAVFQELSAENLEKAIQAANRLDEKLKAVAVTAILTTRVDLDDDVRLNLAREFDLEPLYRELATQHLLEDSKGDPASTWDQVLDAFGDNLETMSSEQKEMLINAARSWIALDGMRAFDEIYSSITQRENRSSLVHQLLPSLITDDSVIARDMVDYMFHDDRAGLLQVMQHWAAEDGWEAFAAAQWMDTGFEDPSRMQRAALEEWAKSNPHTLMVNLAQLPERFQEFSRSTALLEMRWTSPESVPQYLDAIDDTKTFNWLRDNLMSSWIRIDPAAAYKWGIEYEKRTGDDRGYERQFLVALSNEDPQEALSLALQSPLDDSGVGQEAFVVTAFVWQDGELNLEIMDQMRNEETRLAAYTAIGHSLMRLQDYERLLKIVSDEKTEFQFKYFDKFVWQIADWAPEFLVEKFDTLPDEKFKRVSSEALLSTNLTKPFPFLSDAEIAKLEQFVDSETKLE